jgi:DNA-directed RNA polymerase subunit RPC12/RpoP
MNITVAVGAILCVIFLVTIALWWRKKRQDQLDLSMNGRCPNCKSILRDSGISYERGDLEYRGGSNYLQSSVPTSRIYCKRCGYKRVQRYE